jgi:predicted Zn-dependent peptidase
MKKMTSIALLVPAAALVLCTAAFESATAQKQTPPVGAPAKAFTVPAHQTYTLPNGLKVTLVPYANISKVTISLAVNAGSIDDGAGHGGVASLTGELLKEGSATLTPQQLADAAATMGSALDVSVSDDQIIAGLDVLSEFGPNAVRLLADVIEHPRLPDSELPRLKNDMLRQNAVAASRPRTIAAIHFRKILYGDHPYSVVLPPDTEVKALNIDDVKTYFTTNFNPQRSHLYVAGKFDSGSVKKAIAESFGKWPNSGGPWKPNVPSPKPQHVLDVTDRPGAPQSTLMVGLPVPPPNPGRDSAAGHQCTARRLLQFTHHRQHPRAEGLHLFTQQPDIPPLPRRLLGRERRRDHPVHRAFTQGDLRRDRPSQVRSTHNA